MTKRIKEYFFPFLVALSAFSLAGAAAFFSVTGLSKLFGGAQGAVIIMASSLEFSKLVTASFLHKYWKTIDWKLKTYLTIGTVTIMFITSAGIYGFLSSAYSETSNKLDNIDGQIALVEQKKKIVQDDITRLETNQKLKQDRVQSLITLRTQQEARVDSLYNRGKANIAKRVEDQINQSNSEITKVTAETDGLGQKIQAKNDEMANFDTEILELKNNDIAGEVGPLKYIAKLTGSSMDSVVNFFILLLIFVFDPMAVCLVIATNITMERAGLKSLADIVPKKKEEEEVIEEEEEAKEDKEETEGLVLDSETEEVAEVVNSDEIEDDLDSNVEFFMPHQDSVEIKPMEVEVEQQPIAEVEVEKEEVLEESVEEVVEEKIEYKSNEQGEFIQQDKDESISSDEAIQILNDIKLQGIQTNEKYQVFLDSLYMNGSLKIDDTLPPYSKFIEELSSRGIHHEDQEVLDFLTICNLLKITDMNGSDRRVAKDYNVAKGIFKVLSSK
jgi:hypothetical protein